MKDDWAVVSDTLSTSSAVASPMMRVAFHVDLFLDTPKTAEQGLMIALQRMASSVLNEKDVYEAMRKGGWRCEIQTGIF